MKKLKVIKKVPSKFSKKLKNKNLILIGRKIQKPKVQDFSYWANRPIDDKEKDWNYGEENWLDGYVMSIDHSHRQQILDSLKTIQPFGGVLEIGCNTGANLIRISHEYPENQMTGIDINIHAIQIAKRLLPKAILKVANYENIPFQDKTFDIVIADATLLYVGPDKIQKVLNEMDRVCNKGMILVERYSSSLEGEIVGHVYGRNYKVLLEQLGFEIEEFPVLWESSKNWQKFGKLFIARRV